MALVYVHVPGVSVEKLSMAGYSGTPLVKKLGIKEGTQIFLVGAPQNYLELVAPLPCGARLTDRLDRQTDLIHIFATERARLIEALRTSRANMKPDGVIWVSWPKKSSKTPTDITEDTIREVALPMGLVDIKVCAVDTIWSGLKLVVRKEKRTS
jgi:Protein of unknown function (DUF3052)